MMRLSLVESAIRDEQGGAGLGETFGDEDGPSSRRVSSYAAPSVARGTQHRRVASDAGAGASGGPPMGHVDLQSLMDDQDVISSHPPLTPTKTGAVLQSKNPFLSPLEHENETTGLSGRSPLGRGSAGPAMPNPSQTNYLSPSSSTSRQASSTSLRGNPGVLPTSPLPQQRHRLPKPPDSAGELPSGPPPPVPPKQSPGASGTPPALPPRVRPSSVGASSGSTPHPQLVVPPIDHRAASTGGGDPLGILRDFDTVFLGRLFSSFRRDRARR